MLKEKEKCHSVLHLVEVVRGQSQPISNQHEDDSKKALSFALRDGAGR